MLRRFTAFRYRSCRGLSVSKLNTLVTYTGYGYSRVNLAGSSREEGKMPFRRQYFSPELAHQIVRSCHSTD